MYTGVTDFQRVLEIEEKVIEPMERVLKSYEKSRQGLIKLKETKPEEAEKKFQDLMQEDTNIIMIPVNKKEVRDLGFNVFEYRIIKPYIL